MATTTTQEQVRDRIIEAIASFGPDPEEVTPDAKLEELDIDSLDLAELAQIVEDEFGVKLDSSDVGDLKTVGDAIDLVAARSG